MIDTGIHTEDKTLKANLLLCIPPLAVMNKQIFYWLKRDSEADPSLCHLA